MTDNSRSPISMAVIHNTALPHPLGDVSTMLTASSRAYMGLSNQATWRTIDIATWNLPPEPKSNTYTLSPDEEQHVLAWQNEISSLDGFIFLIPMRIWALTKAIKSAISYLPRYTIRGKPALVVAFGKEDDRHWELQQEKPGHIPRKAAPMMKEFLDAKGFQVLSTLRDDGPEFEFWADIWDNNPLFPGGNLIEVWEHSAWNPMSEAGRKIREIYKLERD